MYKILQGVELKNAIEFTLSIFFKDEYNRGVFSGSKPVYVVVSDEGRYASRTEEQDSVRYDYRDGEYINHDHKNNNLPYALSWEAVSPRPKIVVTAKKPLVEKVGK